MALIVGSREAFAAALKAGADSIYFGIESLTLRSDVVQVLNGELACGVRTHVE